MKLSLFLTACCVFAISFSSLAHFPESEKNSKLNSSRGFYFIENQGQFLSSAKDVLYMAHSANQKWLVTDKGIKLTRFKLPDTKSAPDANSEDLSGLRIKNSEIIWNGASKDMQVMAQSPLEFYVNYPSHHISGLQAYQQLKIRNLYPGIDLLLNAESGKMSYEFVVHPGADPSVIDLKYLAEGDSLIARAADGKDHEDLSRSMRLVPVMKTEAGNSLRYFQGEFEFSDEFHSYILGSPLDINNAGPMQVWDIYYGGDSSDFGWSTATDPQGNIFLAGYTFSPNDIASNGHQVDYAGSIDAFVVKFDSQGNRLWASYFGGNRIDKAFKVATDATGNVYLVGHTRSTKGIGFENSHQKELGGSADAFIVKFDPDGKMLWSSYLGGSGEDQAFDVTCDAYGNVYLAGNTESTQGISRGSLSGESDGFLAKFSSSGSMQWSTYTGGSDKDYGRAVSVSAAGTVYLAGVTYSQDKFGQMRSQAKHSGGSDVFLSAYSGSGSLQWTTLFGGKSIDDVRAISCDPTGNVYLAGYTFSRVDIATSGVFQEQYGGGSSDAYVAKFNGSGQKKWCSYFGGSKKDRAWGVLADASGNVYLAGGSGSFHELNITDGQSSAMGKTDAFLIKFNGNGNKLWAMIYGSENEDYGRAVCADILGNIYLSGSINNNAAFLVKYRESECQEPVASFDVAVDQLKCSFTDNSSNLSQDAEYHWDIDCDGVVDYKTKGAIAHEYPEKGTFKARLIIRQGACQSVFETQVVIK
jgi:hypothetical protein